MLKDWRFWAAVVAVVLPFGITIAFCIDRTLMSIMRGIFASFVYTAMLYTTVYIREISKSIMDWKNWKPKKNTRKNKIEKYVLKNDSIPQNNKVEAIKMKK